MSLKKFLLIPLIISVVVFAHFSDAVIQSFHLILESVPVDRLMLLLLFTAMLQVAGHIIRAQKMRLLLNPVKLSTLRFQFRALSIGYLFDAILPFRLGELIRAQIIAGAETISFGYALSLIIIERIVDAIMLALVGLSLFALVGLATKGSVIYASTLLFVAALLSVLIALLVRQNPTLLRIWYRSTKLFNPTLESSLRFKLWSVIYGLQQSITKSRLTRYLALTLISWLCYGLSTFVIAQYLFPSLAMHYKLGLTASPYFGISIPAGPANLGVYSNIANTYTGGVPITSSQHIVFNLLSWGTLIGPISLLGVVFFFVKTKEALWRTSVRRASLGSFMNKLSRTEDISQEMSKFLENYFSGNTLSRIVHRLELQKNFRLLKYFKGGSDAITILALQDGKEVVKKIIPLEFEDRLRAQYKWLAARSGKKGIVKVLGEEKAKDYYAINLEYRDDDVMFFDFMHQNSSKRNVEVVEEVWDYLLKSVHAKRGRLTIHVKERKQYIDKHIFGCFEKATKVDAELLRAAEPAKIIINGHEYDNLYQIMAKIRKHPQAWKDIATYRESGEVHGDVAVDNILVSSTSGHALLIDPAPDGNIINGPVLDFGKNMQSLYCGYEFLLRDDSPIYLEGNNTISYSDHMSTQYTQLCEYVRTELAPKYLSEPELRSIIFHAGALHIRRLKHQVYYNPANTLKFYAVGVKAFNDFLAQYIGA